MKIVGLYNASEMGMQSSIIAGQSSLFPPFESFVPDIAPAVPPDSRVDAKPDEVAVQLAVLPGNTHIEQQSLEGIELESLNYAIEYSREQRSLRIFCKRSSRAKVYRDGS